MIMILDFMLPIYHGFCECACFLFRQESVHWCHVSYTLMLLFEEHVSKGVRSLIPCRWCLGAFILCRADRGLLAVMLS